MATQEITVDAFSTLCAECSDALASSDYKTAASKYAQAQAVHLGLLNSNISTAGDSVTRFQALSALQDAINFAMKMGGDQSQSRFITARFKHN